MSEDYVLVIGDKNKREPVFFDSYSMGVKTNRDPWVLNFSRGKLDDSLRTSYGEYLKCYEYISNHGFSSAEAAGLTSNRKEIKWTSDLLKLVQKKRISIGDSLKFVKTLYRPYTKHWYFDDADWSWTRHLMPSYFPEINVENVLICVSGVGARSGFTALIADSITNLHTVDTGQCFPLYVYEKGESVGGLFDQGAEASKYARRDAVTDEGLQYFLDAYPGEQISKEDIFFYVYGLLHSQEYRDRYADNLSKELPRIPRVKTPEGFWGFSKAGRELAEWHLNYETIEPYKATVEEKGDKSDKVAFYRVEKMKHPKVKNEEGKSVNDLSKVIYNSRITVSDIPVEAYDYVVNGKPAIEWVIERQCVKTDKDSGIVNDANDWANETMNDPRYPLDLLLRVIRVSLETNRIVASLPALDID